MKRMLNCNALSAVCNSKGISPAQLAKKLEVSREAVSKWLNGESVPRPDKLLKLGLFLKIKYSDMIIEERDADSPIVAYRKKAHHKTTPGHIGEAENTGRLLEKLLPYLQFNQYQQLPILENPVNSYEYLQKVCSSLREELHMSENAQMDVFQLVNKFRQLNAIIIPVLWKEKKNHGHALHIYLPSSKTTWIFLNIDALICDFKFIMAHELAHVYAPSLRYDEGEDFADAFAQSLLFPESLAKTTYQSLSHMHTVQERINCINAIAERLVISPYTIKKAIDTYISHYSLTQINLGSYGSVTNFNKASHSVCDEIFNNEIPTPKAYIAKAEEKFKTPFFEALKKYLKDNGPRDSFVQQIMQSTLVDAKALTRER